MIILLLVISPFIFVMFRLFWMGWQCDRAIKRAGEAATLYVTEIDVNGDWNKFFTAIYISRHFSSVWDLRKWSYESLFPELDVLERELYMRLINYGYKGI